jgi:hypothetical protein
MTTSSVLNGRLGKLIFWVIIAGLAFNALRTHAPAIKAAMRAPKPVAYTVVLDMVTLQPNGSPLPTHRLTWAVRGDGSRVFDMISVTPDKPFSERIIDFASGEQITIMEHKAKKSTTFDPVNHTPSKWVLDAGNNCLSTSTSIPQQSLGEEMVDGYRTVKIASGQGTRWHALDYGCALVKDRMEWSDGQVSEKKLVTLVPGEPSPSLFDDPNGFEEIPPSQMFSESSSRQEEYYQNHRPAKN